MNLKWTTKKVKVKDLKPFEGNPRKMSKEQAQQLLDSLKKFNLAEIPAVNTDNTILAGNMRVQALKELGCTEEIIEVRMPNRKLNDDEAREYLIRSNKNTGEWDFDLLANFDESLLKDIGFDGIELGSIFKKIPDKIANTYEYMTFIVTPKQKMEIKRRLNREQGKNRSEKLLSLIRRKHS